MKLQVDRRRRLRAGRMQAAIDGGEATDHAHPRRMVQRPPTKPVQPPRGDDPLLWFAVWNVRRSVAYALDVYLDELILFERALKSARHQVGDYFAVRSPRGRRRTTLRSRG